MTDEDEVIDVSYEPSTWKDTHYSQQLRWNNYPDTTKNIFLQIELIQQSLLPYILSLPCVTNRNDIPKNISGVYILYDIVNREILYIGKSVDIKIRWRQRRDFIIDKVRRLFYLDIFSSDAPIETLEGLFIFIFSPRYNRRVNNRVMSWKDWTRVWKSLGIDNDR